jgi:hypothetical protein
LARWALTLGLFAVGAGSAGAATPSNAELYRMLMELKGDVQRLRSEAAQARAEADAAKAELAETRQELETARKEPAAAPAGRASTETPWSVGVDVLYLRPSAKYDYAILDPINGGQEPDVGSQILSVDPNYDTGYRLSLGYAFPSSGVDVTGRYASLDTSEGAHDFAGSGDLHPISTHVDPKNEDAVETRARMDLDYQAFDLEVGKSIAGSSGTQMRFHAGLRSGRIEQKLDAEYIGNGDFTPADDILAGNPSTLSTSSEYEGIGARIGGLGSWEVIRGLHLFGGVAASLLVGDLDISYRDRQYDNNERRYEDRGLTGQDEQRVVPVIEGQIGAGWQFVTGSAVVEIALGYQFETWIGALASVQFADTDPDSHMVKNYDDLTLQGPFLRVSGRF